MGNAEAPIKILLVDDQPKNLLALKGILKPMGHTLIMAQSGSEALSLLLADEFAVILLAAQMPELDGFETAARIRAQQRGHDTPIIFLSASATSQTLILQAYSLGAVDYLTRPISPEILRSKVSVFIDLYRKTQQIKLQSEELKTVITALEEQIREREQAEAALRESEALFRELAENINDAFWIFDPQRNKILYVSPAYEQIWHQSRDSVYQDHMAFLERIHPDDIPRVRQGRADWLTRDYDLEYRIIRPDGSIRWIWSRAFPVRNEAGEIYRFAGISKDISERKQTEQALAQMVDIIESSADAIIGATLDGIIFSWNSGAEQIYGYTSEEMFGQPLTLLVPQEGRLEVAQNLKQIRAGEAIESYESVRVRKDAQLIDVSLTVSPIRDSAGSLSGVSFIARDISERKRAEEQVRLYADIVRHMQIGLYVYQLEQLDDDSSLRLIAANPAAESFTGAATTIGQTIDENFPGLRALGIPQSYAEVVRTGVPLEIQDLYYGDERQLNSAFAVKAFPLPNNCVGVSFENITERKRAEEELQRQYRTADHARSEMRAILDATSEAMALVGPDRTFLTINRTFLELFGVTDEEILGHRFDQLQALVQKIFSEPEKFRAMVAGSADDMDHTFRMLVLQHWPEQRELALSSTPVHSENNEYLGRLYALRDVTQEREIDRMKSEFVSLVSHELRTPLTSIKGFVDLMLEGEVGEVGDEQREFLEIVKNNADRLVKLINDLLDISRMESGRMELQLAPVDMTSVIMVVVNTMRPQIESKQQKLQLSVAPNLPHVLGNHDRIIQILTNLLSNAYKYTPRGGTISLRAYQHGEFARVIVQDTGVGLTPEDQSRIFTKFFRAKNRVTQEASGTGLGLAITRSLIEMHGGQIMISSTPGEGSTFSFTLPATPEALERKPLLGAARVGARILVIDDERDIANLVQRYLERAGYKVLAAYSAAEGFRMAQEERPDLIILDVLLPDADGLTLLEWIKHNPITSGIPVVLLSIMPDSGNSQQLGAVDYLTKPVNERLLIERVSDILDTDQPPVVLIADDEADMREQLVEQLRRAGYETIEASDGAQALKLVRQNQPGLLLLDIKMSEIDGLEVLRELRADPSTRDLPVIMMTASAGVLEQSRSTVEALGGAALLRKPCSPEELAEAISQGLTGLL